MSSLQFKTVTLCDKAWVDPIVMAENSPSADYNFGNIYIWDKYYKQLICRFEERMITKLRYEGERAFVFPIGSGPLKPAVEALKAFCDERGYPLLLRGVTEQHCQELEDAFPGRFTFTLEERLSEYIYSAEKLSTLRGGTGLGLRPAQPRTDSGLSGHAGRLDRGEFRASGEQHQL